MSEEENKLLPVEMAGTAASGVAVLAQQRLKKVALQNGIEAAGERMMQQGLALSAETGSAGVAAGAEASTALVATTGGSALIPTAGTAVVATGGGSALVPAAGTAVAAAGESGALVVAGEGAAAVAGGAVTLGASAMAAPVVGAAAIVAVAAHKVNEERQKLEDNIASIKPELEGSKKFGNVVHEMRVMSKTLDEAGAKKDANGNYDLTDANTVKIVSDALQDRVRSQQQVASDNHLSLPAWMDLTESRRNERSTEDSAKDELARVRAAQAELTPMAQDAQAKKATQQPDNNANPDAPKPQKMADHKPKLVATEVNRQAQAILAELGYTKNAEFAIRSGQAQFDGKEGALTDKDVTNFQRDHQKDGLKVTGKLDDETLAALAQEVRKLKPDGISAQGVESVMLKPLDTPVSPTEGKRPSLT